MPGIARLVRAATLEVSVRAYVEAATARGERTHVILLREILPNITGVLLADVGIRFAGAVLLGAALSYVGLGTAPPAADWALMVSENRSGLTSNPWVVLAPAALIVMLTISANLIADGIARRRSRIGEIGLLMAARAPLPGEATVDVEELRVELRDGAPIVEDVSFSLCARRAARARGRVRGREDDGRPRAPGLRARGQPHRFRPCRRRRHRRHGGEAGCAREPARWARQLRAAESERRPQPRHARRRPGRRGAPGARPAGGSGVVAPLFDHVSLPTDRRFLRRFPHQLSGGQQQRVVIAMALACRPRLVVLDEPTTALDVITQARILELIGRLRDEGESAFVYVTHDIAAVAGIASSIAVLYAGRVVESGPRDAILFGARHPYTRALVRSVPRIEPGRALTGIPGVAPSARTRPPGCAFAPRCELAQPRCTEVVPPVESPEPGHTVRCLRFEDTAGPVEPAAQRPEAVRQPQPALRVEGVSAAYGAMPVLDVVSFDLRGGECLAVVGESGSGKTTLARCIAGLHQPRAGSISAVGEELAGLARQRTREQRRAVQIVFQNPDESLNPRVRVRDSVARPARQLLGLDREAAYRVADELLARVRLDPSLGGRYPAQLSGGERQRVSIARALITSPSVLVCDEVTSALDVSVQAVIVELIGELSRTLDLAVLFISHDLAVVSAIADRVLVLERGRICELGETRRVVESPSDPYTRALIAAAPDMPSAPEGGTP